LLDLAAADAFAHPEDRARCGFSEAADRTGGG
jgi:hypothetical protein